MKDWAIRSIKTFIQAFLGVFIPALCTMLQNGWPESLDKAWVIMAPTVSAALAAAICAVWNIALEAMGNSGGAAQSVSEHPPDTHEPRTPDGQAAEFIEKGFLHDKRD